MSGRRDEIRKATSQRGGGRGRKQSKRALRARLKRRLERRRTASDAESAVETPRRRLIDAAARERADCERLRRSLANALCVQCAASTQRWRIRLRNCGHITCIECALRWLKVCERVAMLFENCAFFFLAH